MLDQERQHRVQADIAGESACARAEQWEREGFASAAPRERVGSIRFGSDQSDALRQPPERLTLTFAGRTDSDARTRDRAHGRDERRSRCVRLRRCAARDGSAHEDAERSTLSAFQQVLIDCPLLPWNVAHRLDAQCQRTHPIGVCRRVQASTRPAIRAQFSTICVMVCGVYPASFCFRWRLSADVPSPHCFAAVLRSPRISPAL